MSDYSKVAVICCFIPSIMILSWILLNFLFKSHKEKIADFFEKALPLSTLIAVLIAIITTFEISIR